MTDNLIKNHGTSIIILSYNNLNYTKQCLEVLENILIMKITKSLL